MVFSSAIFLFVFLPSVFLLSRILPGQKAKNALLIGFSLIFYAFGSLAYLPLLLGSVLINYTGGLFAAGALGHKAFAPSGAASRQEEGADALMQAAEAAETEGGRKDRVRRLAVAVTVVLNLLILGVFKYADFVLETVNAVTGMTLPLPGIVLPIGISFFTFQGLSYVIDVYREPETVSRSFAKVLLYISFFPQLVAGPIVKYKDVAAQIDHRTCTPQTTSDGILRFITGLSKKLLLADTVGAAADTVFALTAAELDIRLAWLGAVCYFFQIYYDFSGYSDMAIGLGKMFGFTFRENFLHPYAAGSMRDFWRRWHVSLSSWFRDYLYIPLGGNRKGRVRTHLNKLIVFFSTGLWHGANWTFVLWGLWHGACITLEDWLRDHGRPIPKGIDRIWAMLMVLLAFVLFRADNVAQAGMMYEAMFTGFTITTSTSAVLAGLATPSLLTALVVCAVLSFPLAEKCSSLAGGAPRLLPALAQAGALVLLVLDMMVLASTSFSPFIYFQF